MREIRKSGSMRGCRKRAFAWRACVLLYRASMSNEANFRICVLRAPRVRAFSPMLRYHRSPGNALYGLNTLIFIWTSAFLARIPHPAEVGIRAAAAILFDVAPRIGK